MIHWPGWIAAAFPWIHLMLAGMLVAPGLKSRAPFVATALMGTIFLFAQLAALIRGIPVDCGCFGSVVERQVGLVSICLAGSLVLAAGWVATSRESSYSPLTAVRNQAVSGEPSRS